MCRGNQVTGLPGEGREQAARPRCGLQHEPFTPEPFLLFHQPAPMIGVLGMGSSQRATGRRACALGHGAPSGSWACWVGFEAWVRRAPEPQRPCARVEALLGPRGQRPVLEGPQVPGVGRPPVATLQFPQDKNLDSEFANSFCLFFALNFLENWGGVGEGEGERSSSAPARLS